MSNQITIEANREINYAFRELSQPSRYKVYYGGRGGGRSWEFAREALMQGVSECKFILCAREFQKSINDSVYKLLLDQIKLLNLTQFYKIYKNTIIGVNGTTFIFEGLKHNVTNIKSIEGVDICWVEEAEKVSQDSWDVLIPTIRKEESEIWITFNADLETDPTYKRFVKETPPDTILRKTSWKDNPWFPEVLRREKEYMYAVDPERAAWIWGGECRSHSDAQIMKNKWVIDVFEPESGWYGPYWGCDFGFSKSPLVLLKFWIKPMNDYFDIMIEHEKWGVGIDLNDHAAFFDEIKGCRDYLIYADLSRPETINLLIKGGFNITGAPKWPGCVEDGITWIRSCRKIIIHERCIHTIDDAKNYSYKVDPLTGDVTNLIIKKHDDTWDALRYGATPFIYGQDGYGEIMQYEDQVSISPY